MDISTNKKFRMPEMAYALVKSPKEVKKSLYQQLSSDLSQQVMYSKDTIEDFITSYVNNLEHKFTSGTSSLPAFE